MSGHGKEMPGIGQHVQHELNEPDTTRRLNDCAAFIKGALPPNFGFTLFLFSYGADGQLFYISSAERDDMLALLEEFMEKRGRGKRQR